MNPLAALHAGCAVAYVLAAALVIRDWPVRSTALLLALACTATALWAVAESAWPQSPAAIAFDLLRGLAWFGFALHLYRRSTEGCDGNDRFTRLGFILVPAAVALLLLLGSRQDVVALSLLPGLQIGIAVCTLLVVENAYRNTPDDRRWHVNIPCILLALFSIYQIALSADTELTARLSPILLEGQAVVMAIMAPLFVVTARRNRQWSTGIHLSRSAAFHSATLVLSGIFLLGLVVIGEAFRSVHGAWGGVVEISLVFAGVGAMAILGTSGSIRSRLSTLLIDHFFAHRYDYRAEWTKSLRTLSVSGIYSALHARAIRAVADVVDSPGGILLLREPGESAFRWAGSLNMPAHTMPLAPDHPLIAPLAAGEWVIEAGDLLQDDDIAGIWLAVALQQERKLLGVVLLAPSRAAFRLDHEALELLRIVAQAAANHVAEQQASQLLMQSRQFEEYGKRFAFVAHDIKNVSSQLGLVLSNAELHMQDPEFQQDVLTTVRASVRRIATLLSRLEAGEETARGAIAPLQRLDTLIATTGRITGATIVLEHDGLSSAIAMDPGAFDAVVTHLLNNAIEASTPASEIRVGAHHHARHLTITIADHGAGMTETFMREQLFQPFVTSKSSGSGIGAFQARELLRIAGGDLRASSEVGKGTTMQLVLPLIERAVLQSLPLSA